MLLDKYAKVRWNSKIKKHYVSLGYEFTKMGDEFDVKVDDLTDGSNVLVNVKCDYCGKTIEKPWYRYITELKNSTIKKDCCNDCKKHKIVDTSLEKYGVESVLSLKEVKDKIKSTNVEKYGVENVFESDEIKEKISETNTNRYGFKSPMMNKSIQDKMKNTCKQKYGVDYFVLNLKFKGKDSPRWKGGVSRIRSERFTYEYVSWRKAVFDRDMYTCQCCNARNGNGYSVKLNAHHIMNWKDYPQNRFDIDNGITLCEECHNEFHSRYGKSKNTEGQIKEFILNHGKKVR